MDISIAEQLADKGPALAIGGFVVWLVKSGYLDKLMVWRKEDRQQTRKEAQEGLLMVLESTTHALTKCEAALAKTVGELHQSLLREHECEKKLSALTVRVEFLEKIGGIQKECE